MICTCGHCGACYNRTYRKRKAAKQPPKPPKLTAEDLRAEAVWERLRGRVDERDSGPWRSTWSLIERSL